VNSSMEDYFAGACQLEARYALRRKPVTTKQINVERLSIISSKPFEIKGLRDLVDPLRRPAYLARQFFDCQLLYLSIR
jgi:hypothetical protein